MIGAARRFEPALVVPALLCGGAWSALALCGRDVMLPGFCSPGAPWAMPLSASFHVALLFNSVPDLAAGWVLMLGAMMAPLLVAPLRYICNRSFARRRARAMLLFIGGYTAVWMVAGVALAALAFTARWAMPDLRVCFAVVASVAIAWQVSPAKQWCLNRCHRQRRLSAFGAAADRDAFAFGLTHGVSCTGACWVLMLLPLVAGHAHIWAMIAAALFAFGERLERPSPLAWRWRGPGKAMRIVMTQVRMGIARPLQTGGAAP